jgi:hypothetical protein
MKFVYFIQAGNDGPIKIGIAQDVPRRLTLMQHANAEVLWLLTYVPGAPKLERLLHKHFAGGRLRGEWFDPATAGLRDFIDWLREDIAMPAVDMGQWPAWTFAGGGERLYKKVAERLG